jgi:Mrp family chromosome partitioning ATPase
MVADVKPEMTVPTAVRVLLRWSWLIVALALAGGAAGLILSARQHRTYQATVQVNFVQYQPNKDNRTNVYQPSPVTLRTPADWSAGVFQDPDVASQVAKQVGGITGARLLSGLKMTPISTTQVSLSFTTANAIKARTLLNTYTSAFLAKTLKSLNDQIEAARKNAQTQITNLSATHPNPQSGVYKTIQQLQGDVQALNGLSDQVKSQLSFHPAGGATLQSKPISKPVAIAGGGLAGFAAGILLVLVASRVRGRVGDRSEIEELGVRVVEIDSAEGADPLRLELDVIGVGRGLRAISVSAAADDDGATGVGLALARAYAAVGVPTLLITADTAAPYRSDLPGLAEFLSDPGAALKPYAVSPDLAWLPPGGLNAESGRLFTSGSISRLLTEARRLAHVLIIETGPIAAQPEAALPIACSDVAVVVMRSHRTTRVVLGEALREADRAAPRTPVVCVDHADPRSAEVVPRVASSPQSQVPVTASGALDFPGGA